MYVIIYQSDRVTRIQAEIKTTYSLPDDTLSRQYWPILVDNLTEDGDFKPRAWEVLNLDRRSDNEPKLHNIISEKMLCPYYYPMLK